MKRLKKGDRVLVYGNAGPHPTIKGFELFLRGEAGTVELVYDGGEGGKYLGDITVILDRDKHEVAIHALQCRPENAATKPEYLYAVTDAQGEGVVFGSKKDLLREEGPYNDEYLKLKVVARKKIKKAKAA